MSARAFAQASDDSGSDEMPGASTGLPSDRLIELVMQMLSKNSITRAPSIHDQLSEAGLTSLDMVNLMIAVEAEFSITIPASDITPANFRSISTIEALIVRIATKGTQ
jgi:acyl carrier protein